MPRQDRFSLQSTSPIAFPVFEGGTVTPQKWNTGLLSDAFKLLNREK